MLSRWKTVTAVDELCRLAIAASDAAGTIVLDQFVLAATADAHESDPKALGAGFRVVKSRRGP